MNVLTEVVAQGHCIGCGVCAAACPAHRLNVGWNVFGEYEPQAVSRPCRLGCKRCLEVCPFCSKEPSSAQLQQTVFAAVPGTRVSRLVGHHREIWIGHATELRHRRPSASGGLLTTLLLALLRENLIDAAVCVAPARDQERLFEYRLAGTPEDLEQGRGSCYYPVELSRVLGRLRDSATRVAVVALPCVALALRKYAAVNPRFQRNLRFILGLTCGQTKSRFFAEYLCAKAGGNPHCLQSVRFRGKAPGRPAWDFAFEYGGASGEAGALTWSQGIADPWCRRYFTPRACGWCDDVFAECADATFMDAWLPGVQDDWRGESLVLLRQPELAQIVSNLPPTIEIHPARLADAVRSQLGVVESKRSDTLIRRRWALETGETPFQAREGLKGWSVGKQALVRAGEENARLTRELWPQVDKNLARFTEAMAPAARRTSEAVRQSNRLAKVRGLLRRLRIGHL